MHFTAAAATRKGKNKETNQDSLLVKHILFAGKEVLMAVVCDGVGGLCHGELASGTVIKRFSKWFDEELIFELETPDFDLLADEWRLLIRQLNSEMISYSEKTGEKMGTTFSGLLIINDRYLLLHVGDTRIYHFDLNICQLTTDQTFIEREIELGRMSQEDALEDKRKNALLQCVGASAILKPQIQKGPVTKGIYLICSDGFRHKLDPDEIHRELKSTKKEKEDMQSALESMIDKCVERKESDDISVICIFSDQKEF